MSKSNAEAEGSSSHGPQGQHQHEYGRRLLTTMIDDRARCNHPRPFAAIPRSADPKDGYRDISYRLFADAINRCAWWMERHLSLSDHFETLIYVGAFDLRYQILANAAVKTGYVMFFISPRNSLDAQLSLLDAAKVSKILVSSGSAIESVISPILQHRSIQKYDVPELEDLLSEDEEVTTFEFNGTFDEYRMKPWILLHTSGSTGFPKIVTLKHGYPTSFDAFWRSAEDSDMVATFNQKRTLVPYPPFHMAGIVVNLAGSMYMDATVVLPPAGAPLTAEIVNDICVNARVDHANLPPFILMDMIKNPTHLECLRGLNNLAYGGGPLPQETGDEISKFVSITSFYGSTEACIVPSRLRPRKDWKYFNFDVKPAGIEMRLIENSTGVHELVYVRDPQLSLSQAIFITFPEIDEYRSKDLFTKHPSEPDLWRYEGRLDDILVLTNAEKINPVAMEGTITSCPVVKGALVIGTGRFQTALLVEVIDPPQPGQVEERTKLLDSIWPFVEMANQQCPVYGRISRELIGFARVDKPFLRASKGTIQRPPTLQLYSKEIDDLYAYADNSQSQPTQHTPIGFEDVGETEDFLRRWFQRSRVGELKVEQDFFNSGMDSLDVVNLMRQIRSLGQDVSVRQVYNNPSIKQLARSLKDTHHGQNMEIEDDKKKELITMQQLHHDFRFNASEQMKRADSTTNVTAVNSKHVILIGSTGSLGPYLLNGLLADPTVANITCLNRSTDAPSRQQTKHSTLGLSSDFQRVRFLRSNVSEASLGLASSDCEELTQSVTHIIFNAWTVDFNQNVSSFKPLLQGVKNLVELTYGCMPRKVRLFFMSSVSVADRHRVTRPKDLVPESIINDWSLAEMGYGQSKLVAEGLISEAVDRYGIDAAICRLCQLGGPVQHKGEWTRVEWIPSLIFSSKTMGVIPESLGPLDMVDWLPIDIVADICLELLFHGGSSDSQKVQSQHVANTHTSHDGELSMSSRQAPVWHVVNPNPTLWSRLLPFIMPFMPKTVKPIDFVQWVERLAHESDSKSAKNKLDIEHVPSLKLLPLFRRLHEQALKYPRATSVAAFDTTKTVACSKTLAQIPAVNSTWMELWMKQWET